MFKLISRKDKKVVVEMDLDTYTEIKEELQEDINSYEFIFDKPVETDKLLVK